MWRSTPYADAEAMPTPSDPHLATRNFAPVPDETTLTGLSVEGALPTALTGRYVRIGPNAVASSTTPAGRTLDGMVHAVELHAGRAVRYRNRWVTTDNVARTLGTDPTPALPPHGRHGRHQRHHLRRPDPRPGPRRPRLRARRAARHARPGRPGRSRPRDRRPPPDRPAHGCAPPRLLRRRAGAPHRVAQQPDPDHRPRPRCPRTALRPPPDPRTLRPPRRRVRRHHRPHRPGGAPLGRRQPPRCRHRQ